MIQAVSRKIDGGGGIRHGMAEPVRHQIGRAHQIHELLVNHPAALVLETLGLDQKAFRMGGKAAQ
ncbi:MAG: hypothetical protein LBC18_03980 [Opitutaceae bacterium]|nr:hypothetical protein [Opitutaceae bacterium]